MALYFDITMHRQDHLCLMPHLWGGNASVRHLAINYKKVNDLRIGSIEYIYSQCLVGVNKLLSICGYW